MTQIEINEKWCKGCGICVDFCPKHVFDQAHLGAKPSPERVEDCVGCLTCELKCPDMAITVIKD